jgi:hypothetical protein
MRDRRITLLAAREGLHVTLEDASGTPVRGMRDVPVDALKGVDPDAYELLRTSVASSRTQPLDARLDLR